MLYIIKWSLLRRFKLNLVAIVAIVTSVSLFAGMIASSQIFAQGNSSGNNTSSNGRSPSPENGNLSMTKNNINMMDKMPNNMTR